MKQLFTIFVIAFSGVFATCSKERINCKQNSYSFEIGVQAYPDKESIAIDDTIWIAVEEPVILTDLNQVQKVDYSGAINLGTNIGFQEIIGTVPQIRNVANDFSFKLVIGTEVQNANAEHYREFLFKELNGNYVFKLGIIPKRAGVFRFTLGNAVNVYRDGDKCTKASFLFNFKNTNQHFHLYPGGSNTPSGGATYFFAVK